MLQQYDTLKKAATLWASQIQKGKLSRADAWLALTSTIWKSLFYPLPTTCLSKQQCESIMSPAINQAVVAMGFRCNFPREVVFAPQKYLGLSIPHIHMWQEILCLQVISTHTAKDTFTGHLYRASLEYLIIEVGVGESVLYQNYCALHFLATPSLIRHTWQFLSEYNITLKHDIKFSSFRSGDLPLCP